jgi:hypothetical protein
MAQAPAAAAAAGSIPFDPVSLGVAAVSTGLSFLTANAQEQARQQEYLNQTAFQNATTQFNQWQAGFNADMQNLNNQYSYWATTVDYNQKLGYTQQLRNYEFAKEIDQASRVAQTRASAGTGYAINAAAVQQQLQERGMQEAVAIQQFAYRALQSSAAFQASMQEGKSSDRYVANFSRQMGDYKTLKNIEQGLRDRQYNRDQLAQITRYLNEYNSQTFYEKQPYLDPVAPFPPLPTMVTPPPPSMTGSAPANMSALNAGTSVLGGVNAYLGTAAKIKAL